MCLLYHRHLIMVLTVVKQLSFSERKETTNWIFKLYQILCITAYLHKFTLLPPGGKFYLTSRPSFYFQHNLMQTPFMMRKKIKKPITQVNIGWIANELVFANSQCSSSSSSNVQLYLWSAVNRCGEPLAVKTWALRRGGGATSHAPHFLWLRRRGSEHRRGDVGCASAGNSTHPVPPSALVPGRKHGHDPTQIRARSWAAAMWQMTPDNGGTILLCVCVYEGEGERNTIRERKKEFLQPCMATG